MQNLLILTLLLLPFQSLEYGKPADLKGVTKVFVDTGADMRNRERILKELNKSKLPIELLDSEEGAEVVMAFGSESSDRVTGVIHNRGGETMSTSTPVWRKVKQGAGQVFVLRDGKVRLVMSFEDEMRSGWEREPATNFAREFAKQYRKANGLKK
jgi:hypothetical protein